MNVDRCHLVNTVKDEWVSEETRGPGHWSRWHSKYNAWHYCVHREGPATKNAVLVEPSTLQYQNKSCNITKSQPGFIYQLMSLRLQWTCWRYAACI